MQVVLTPNLATGSTRITLSGVCGPASIEIVDLAGRTLHAESLQCAGACQKPLSIEDLAPGAYFVRIVSNNVNTIKKLIVR